MSWFNAINPAAAIPDETQATRAARAASIALFLGGAYALVMIVLAMTSGGADLRAAANAAAVESGLQGRGSDLVNGLIWAGVLFGVVQLAVGAFQWVRPGLIVPIIVTILVVWGLVQTLLTLAGLATGTDSDTIWLKLALLVIQVLLCLSAIRGANVLERFRKAQGG